MPYATMNTNDEGRTARPGSVNSSIRARRRYSSRSKDTGVAGQATWISSVVNLVNTIVGAGVLAMPLAISHMGISLGLFVLVWSGLTAGFGLYLQSRCARYLERGSSSFFALSQITYPNAAIFFDTAIAIKCFGVGVSYLIIIGDLMPGVVRGLSDESENNPFLLDRHFWVTGFMLVVIPLSFLRRLDSLKYTSVIALISISYLAILVVARFAKVDTDINRGPIRVVHWGGAVAALSSFPVIVFAYTCHQNMFSILNEIGNNSHFRIASVIMTSIGLACFIYALVGITGYLTFGNNVEGNIVGMYVPSVASTIGKAAIVILVMFSYPLQVHPCRASVDAVLKWRPNRRIDSPSSPPSRTGYSPLLSMGKSNKVDGMGEVRFAAITSAIIVLSYITAMTVSSLEKVLAYVGSTGSTSISFILPGLFYYKICSPDSPHHQKLMKEDDDGDDASENEEDEGSVGVTGARVGTLPKNTFRWLSLALAIYGVIVMITSLVTNTFFIVAR